MLRPLSNLSCQMSGNVPPSSTVSMVLWGWHSRASGQVESLWRWDVEPSLHLESSPPCSRRRWPRDPAVLLCPTIGGLGQHCAGCSAARAAPAWRVACSAGGLHCAFCGLLRLSPRRCRLACCGAWVASQRSKHSPIWAALHRQQRIGQMMPAALLSVRSSRLAFLVMSCLYPFGSRQLVLPNNKRVLLQPAANGHRPDCMAPLCRGGGRCPPTPAFFDRRA
jgi:hypothetical protein